MGLAISEERCARALEYLSSTDIQSAELKTEVARREYAIDLAEKRVFLTADGNNEERKAIAKVSADVQKAQDDYATALVNYEKVRAKRATEAMIVDAWRSVNANRRQGNV